MKLKKLLLSHVPAAAATTAPKAAAEASSAHAASSGAGSHVQLPACWDEVSRSRGVLGRARLTSETVRAREALLAQCMQALLSIGPPLTAAEPLRAFLALPAEAAFEGCEPPAAKSAAVAAGAPGGGSSAPGSIPSGAGGSSTGPSAAASLSPSPQQAQAQAQSELSMTVRLRTELQPRLPDEELWQRQAGACAGCKGALPSLTTAKQASSTSWLRLPSKSGQAAAKGPRW